jgi:hypothetical protein
MPFIITTTRHLPSMESHDTMEYVERRAVATLEEARTLASDAVYDAGLKTVVDAEQAFTIPVSGGSVGPLPDGTVIEVEHASWDDLVGADGWGVSTTEAEVIAAYNDAQS